MFVYELSGCGFESPLHSLNETEMLKKKQIKNILRFRSLKTKKLKLIMIYISFKNYSQRNDLNPVKDIFCDVIGCSRGTSL